METVVIIGAGGALARRVEACTAEAVGVGAVVSLDTAAASPAQHDEPPVLSLVGATATVQRRAAGLADAPLDELLGGADLLVYLGAAALDEPPGVEAPEQTVAGVRRLLAAAAKAGVPQLVVVSSATIYGAWTANPVPLTEEAPVRPNPEFAPVAALAEVERLLRAWRDAHPAVRVAVLRPATTVAPDRPGWLARSLRAALAFPVAGHDPATQFLHLDDLVGAIDTARREHLDGVFNVAPDGWLTGEARRSLDVRPRFGLPEAWAAKVASLRWRLGTAAAPPELLPYVTHPWVVANGRLCAAGWRPAHTNEEAWVDAHPGGPLATLSPSRRQELILGGAATVAAGGLAGAIALVRRRRG